MEKEEQLLTIKKNLEWCKTNTDRFGVLKMFVEDPAYTFTFQEVLNATGLKDTDFALPGTPYNTETPPNGTKV